MASYTTNYGLHQWESTDDFLRTDFNTDFQKIDAALAGIQADTDGKVEMVTGTYQGDGSDERTITLGFQPKAVVVSSGYYTAVSPFGVPNTGITVTATGFQVQQISSNVTFNMAGYPYTYAAV